MMLRMLHTCYALLFFLFGLDALVEASTIGSKFDVSQLDKSGFDKLTKRQPPVKQPGEASSSSPPRSPSPPLSPSRSHSIHKVVPSPQEIPFSRAQCGLTRIYTEMDILYARDIGCAQLPFNNPDRTIKIADRFPVQELFPTPGGLYIYPLRQQRKAAGKSRDYGLDRIVLNRKCEVVNIISEVPNAKELASMVVGVFHPEPGKPYDQSKYKYVECQNTEKTHPLRTIAGARPN